LELAEQLLILHVPRLHGNRLTRIFHGLRIVVQAALRQGAEEIPVRVSLARRHAAQRVERLGIMTRVDIVFRCAHFNGGFLLRLLLPLIAISAVAAAIAACPPERRKRILVSALLGALLLAIVAAARALAAALTPVHDLLIRLLDFHEFFLRLSGVRLAHVRIGMIALAQGSIRLFDFVIARRRRYAQYLIRICHFSLFAFLRSLAFSNRSHMPE